MSMRKSKTEPHSLSSLREASSRSSERSRLSRKVVEESFSPVSLRDGLSPRDGLSARQKTSPELLETQDAELERLRAALAAAGRAVELASSANGSPELEPKAAPALPEPTATPLLCATALRHTVSACGEGLFCSAAAKALEAQGSEAEGEGERPEESRTRITWQYLQLQDQNVQSILVTNSGSDAVKTRLARATDSLWAEILQQQALRLTQLESENQSLRWRADRLRKTHEPGELRSLLAAQGEVVAQLVPSQQLQTPVEAWQQEATSDAYEAQIQKACLMRRLQSPHAEPLQLLDESLAFSAGRLCEDSRWQEQIHRDALATVEALLLERERLRLMRMPASGVADSLARAEDLCRALSDEVEENQVDATPAPAKVSSRRPSFQGQMPSEASASNSFYTRSAQDVEKTPRSHNAREVVGGDRTPPRRPSCILGTVSSPAQAPAAMKQPGPAGRQRLNSQPASIGRQPPSLAASHRVTPRGAPARSSLESLSRVAAAKPGASLMPQG
eukprot:s1039_g11.t1